MIYRFSKYIDPYLNRILNNEIGHCEDVEKMIKNNVIPVLQRDDIYIDDEQIKEYLALQKYFPYKLIAWEVFIFSVFMGVKYKANDRAFFNELDMLVGRGTGKNGFISFIAFCLISPVNKVKKYDIDILANTEKQAKTSFNDVHQLLENPVKKEYEKALNANFYKTKEIITCKKTQSSLRFNTSSKTGKDSKRDGAIIFDEMHEYTDSKNIDTLKSGLGKIDDPRVIIISTDGHVRGSVFDNLKSQCKDILSHYDPDNHTLIYYCHIEEEEEWKDETKWIKAIPSIDDFTSLKTTIKNEVKKMKYNIDYFPEFMAKRMNFPIGNKDVEVASWEDIQATNQDIPDLVGKSCVGAVDFAKTNDFVVCCLLFKIGNKYYLIQHTFVCANSKDLPGIKAPIKEWADKGDLTIVNDVEVGPEYVANWFKSQQVFYNIKKIAIDRFRISLLNKELKKIGYDAFETKTIKLVGRNDLLIVAPLINSLFLKHNIVFGDVPIMRWYTNNTKRTEVNNNLVYGKIEPLYRKTDGFMAFVHAMTIESELDENYDCESQIPFVIF